MQTTRKASLPAAPSFACCPTSHHCNGWDRDTKGTLSGTFGPSSLLSVPANLCTTPPGHPRRTGRALAHDCTVMPRHVETWSLSFRGDFNSGISWTFEHFCFLGLSQGHLWHPVLLVASFRNRDNNRDLFSFNRHALPRQRCECCLCCGYAESPRQGGRAEACTSSACTIQRCPS